MRRLDVQEGWLPGQDSNLRPRRGLIGLSHGSRWRCSGTTSLAQARELERSPTPVARAELPFERRQGRGDVLGRPTRLRQGRVDTQRETAVTVCVRPLGVEHVRELFPDFGVGRHKSPLPGESGCRSFERRRCSAVTDHAP